MSLTGNKGEWSEIYVFFRLLGDGKIYAADENLNRMQEAYLQIIKIIREENAGELYEYFTGKTVEIYVNNEQVLSLPAEEFIQNADYLFAQLKNREISGKKGAFPIGETEKFMEKVFVRKIKAPSTALNQKFGGKADITMEVEDNKTGIHTSMAFSVKSDFASPASLVNASEATNFIYQVYGITDEQMEHFNAIDTRYKMIDRANYLKSIEGASVEFVRPLRDLCHENLLLVSNDMPEILAAAMYNFYFEGVSVFSDAVAKLASENPLQYRNAAVIYEKRLKDFLYDCFSGLNPGRPWNGSHDVSGGYIVVKGDGEVLAYHTYIQEAFRQFLLDHCRFDKGSTTKHKYGTIYKENGNYYLRLNLQVRFQ